MKCGKVTIEGPYEEYLRRCMRRWVSRQVAEQYLTQAHLQELERRLGDPRWLAGQQKKAKAQARKARKAEKLKQQLPQV